MLVAVGSLLPWVSSGLALLAGIVVALAVGNPWPDRTRALAHRTLAWSVVGLGAGMNLAEIARVGAHGFLYTAGGIAAALTLGTALGRRLGVSRDTALLVTVGTAICGGSAIASVAPVLRAKHHEVSMALVTVFLLNGIALWVFPFVGRRLHLDEGSFGLWCALAIHDTSSVVGAAAQYGSHALAVAAPTKLARALWIVPVTFGIAWTRSRSKSETPDERRTDKPALPWFIGAFLAAAALVTFVPRLAGAGAVVSMLSHRTLAFTLCLIGLGFSRSALRQVGVRSMAQAVTLWAVLAGASLLLVAKGWVG